MSQNPGYRVAAGQLRDRNITGPTVAVLFVRDVRALRTSRPEDH